MEDFANLLHRDYGLKPQGKMAPMSGSGPSSRGGSGADSMLKGKSTSNGASRSRASTSGEDDLFFMPKPVSRSSEPTYDDVFGGPPKFSAPKVSSSTIPIYDDFRAPPPPSSSTKENSLPVFDAPYDDDIFLGVRGTRPSNISYENVFGGPSSSGSPSDDLLGGYSASQKAKAPSPETSPTYDDELLSGHSSKQAEPSSFISVDDVASKPAEVDPFGGIQSDPFSSIPLPVDDPLDSFTGYHATSNGVGDGLDGFDIFSQPSNVKTADNGDTNTTRDFVETSDEKPSHSTYSQHEPEEDSDGSSPRKQEQVMGDDYIPDYADVPARSSNEAWITIVDVKLLTVPSSMPPPSRPPPAIGYSKKENQMFEDASDTFYVDDDTAAMQRQKEKEILMMKERQERERLEREAEERERQKRSKERELVERANREARERAAKQARERAERIAVEKALQETRTRQAAEARQREEARQKAEAEAKQKAETEARQRPEAEARQRVEAEARQRAEAEARQRAEADAQKRAEAERRAQRAAVERVNAGARERAQRAAEARAREQQQQQQQQQQQYQQQRPADDLDNFFAARANSAPRQRPPTADFPKPPERRSSGGSTVKKVSSASGIDELSNLFDNPESPFRNIDGETAERRKARMDRDQRTQARARQALEEKHRRDMAAQREQAEKERASETVDYEIRRWAAGKEGNIRALLSSLQYVLWPEAGWQAVSLTDLITGASVKKVYRKATLCVHPDKVQQKGATIQQKYIAEKVFDILQEAWKKFNSEELF